MTIREALIAELDEVAVQDSTIDKTLLDQGLAAADNYTATAAQKKGLDLCMIDILYRLYSRADVSEGGYSKSHPDFTRKIEARLLYLAKKHSVTEVLQVIEKSAPTVKDASSKW